MRSSINRAKSTTLRRPNEEAPLTFAIECDLGVNELLNDVPLIDTGLRIMARDGNTLSPVLRSARDSGNLRTLVKHDPLKATGAHISMIGHITRLELLKYLNETESFNGFANRLLFVCVRRSKSLPEGGRISDVVIEALAVRLKATINSAERCRLFEWADAARGLWFSVYPKLSQGSLGLFGAITSRAEAQVLRLSAIYAALDESPRVQVEHLTAALAVWDYTAASARYIFGDLTGDAIADRISAALKVAGEDGLTRADIRDLFKRHQTEARIEQALKMLSDAGLAYHVQIPGDGRTREIWTAT